MRKTIAMLLTIVMVFGLLSACGSSPSSSQANTDNSGQTGNGASQTAEDEKIVLRLAHNAAAGQPMDSATIRLAERMSDATNGRVEIQVFGSNTIGSDAACTDMIKEGTLDLLIVGPTYLNAWSTAVDLMAVPFLLKTQDELKAIYASDWAETYLADKFLQEQNVRLIDYWMQGARQYLGKNPIYEVSDFEGQKLRLPGGSQARTEAWEALGTLQISLGLEDAYTALQSGVCDAVEMPLDFLVAYKYMEEAKYLKKTNHQFYSVVFLANEDSFQKLTDEEQELLISIAKEEGVLMDEELKANDSAYEKEMIDNYGVEITELTDQEFAEINELIAPVYEKNIEIWGRDCYDGLMEIIDSMR